MPDLPSGTVTFLFTDIEGSTQLWERDRAAMAAAVERHLVLLDATIAAHGGVHFKTVGDAVQAAFPKAPDAVTAALNAQRSLLAEDWGELGTLQVRMALHTGEAAPDQRGDYISAPLNRLSRLLSTGHGGQILLSQAVQQLTRGVLPAGVGLRDLGEHRLRDLLEPERVFQLLHPDLAKQFPPLKSLEYRPNNLPRQPTPFLGREREVGEVVGLLRKDNVQLLTLVGPGGTGKTRLALQAGAELLDDFPDGVFFVPLASLTDPDLVLPNIATTLGIREEGSQPLDERLRDFLAEKQVLLVLDNVEHLVDAAPAVGELLGASPGLKVLATSRMPLRLRAEREYPVPPLGLPRRKPPLSPEQLSQYESVRLFIERAQAVKPDFTVDIANGPAVAEICHRLDGLPLAIELAAARVRMFPPQALLARLEQRLPMLTGGARDAPERQRTLRNTIAWSDDLLEPNEQQVFRRLAVFAGGCTLDMAESVTNPDGELDVFAGLERLIEHSLIRQEAGTTNEPRFVMLETIREYGVERLEAAEEAAPIRCQHAASYRALAEAAGPMLRRRGQLPWMDRLEAEHDNLRAVLDWTLIHDSNAAVSLVADLAMFWHHRGFISEGRSWLERALALVSPIASPKRTPALLGAAALANTQMDWERSEELATEALVVAEDVGDLASQAYARMLLGLAARSREDESGAQQLLQGAQLLASQAGDRWTEALCYLNLALTPWNHGDYRDVATLLEAGLAAAEDSGDEWVITIARSMLGLLATDQEDQDWAIALLEQSLARQRVIHDRIGGWSSLLWLGLALRYQGDLDRAEEHLNEALASARHLGDAYHIASSLVALGEVAIRRGNTARAVEYCRDALQTATSAGLDPTWPLRGLGMALVAADRLDYGVRLLAADALVRGRSQEILSPPMQRDLDATAALARSSLGGDSFDAAWSIGQATPLTELISDALAVTNNFLTKGR